MTGSQLATAHKEWIEKNPLRIWRKDNDISIHAAASLLSCSMSSIQLWESGANVPNDDSMARIIKVIGPNIVKRWKRWLNGNPADNL